MTASQLVWAILAGPLIGLIAVPYIRLIGWTSHHRVTGRWACTFDEAMRKVLDQRFEVRAPRAHCHASSL